MNVCEFVLLLCSCASMLAGILFFKITHLFPPLKVKWATPNLHHRYKILKCQATDTFCLQEHQKTPGWERMSHTYLGKSAGLSVIDESFPVVVRFPIFFPFSGLVSI